ncbi:MAG: transporter substrate-binding domain-containing protein [Cardiobacteriaceae bacterium]|nr:transporter substrate-binding domain-containing protein [Cardiobacteriaceae bacterium]
MKKILLTAAMLLAHPLFAAEKLRIGIEGEYPPFSAVDAQGQLHGFDVDIALALCAEMQRDCELVQTAWDGLIPSLNSQKIDAIVASMSATEERRQSVDFTEKYYANAGKFVLAQGAAEGIAADNWRESLKGKTLGVQRATIHDRYASETAKDIFADIRRYNTQEEANLDLVAGRIDVSLADQTALASGFLASADGKGFALAAPVINDPAFYGEGVSIAIRKGDDALRDSLNTAIRAIRANGEYQKINSKYFDFDIY